MGALVRAGFLVEIAYRGEMLVWVLTSTMPFIMLALFEAVAREAPIGRYGERSLVSYFLATFVVRQLTSSWVSWQINMEVRDGTLATRLLRPVHPLLAYAADSVAVMPMRVAVSIPVGAVLVAFQGTGEITRDPMLWAYFAISIAGAWLLSLFVSFVIGGLAFFMESSTKLMDVWLALYFVFSGYLLPVELFPAPVRGAVDALPFRYQIGLPVEIVTGAHGHAEALALLARQWAFVAIGALLVAAVWRRGLARFAAYGG